MRVADAAKQRGRLAPAALLLLALLLLCWSATVSAQAHSHSHSHGSPAASSSDMPRLVDLHTHTTQSDGTLSPLSLVRSAAAQGLSTIAWTDHDQLAFSPAVLHEAQRLGVQVLKGVEISTEWHLHSVARGVKAHLLGYWVKDEQHTQLYSMLRELREKRHDRNMLILDKLAQQHNIHITAEQVLREKQDKEESNDTSSDATAAAIAPRLDYVGRPHFARVLVAENHATSIKDAFNRYLSDEQLQAPEWSIDIAVAIQALDRHGGVAVLAHPSTLNLTLGELRTELRHLMQTRGLPLVGLEAFSSRHSLEQARAYSDLADELGLVVTGGSDFHGKNKVNVDLGKFGGGDEEWGRRGAAGLEQLRQRMEAHMGHDEFSTLLLNVATHLSTYCLVIAVLLASAHVYQRTLPTSSSSFVGNLRKASVVRWTFDGRDSGGSGSNSALTYRATNKATSERLQPSAATPASSAAGSTAPVTARNLHGLSKPLHFLFCACGLQASYLTWGYLQERIMTGEYDGDRFATTEWLVCTNRVSAVLLAAVAMWSQQRSQSRKRKPEKDSSESDSEQLLSVEDPASASSAPPPSSSVFSLHCPPYKYMLCSLTNILSTWLQYESLHFVSFPLQVLSKSSKILFTMLMGRFVSRTHYSVAAYAQAVMIAVGLLLYKRSEAQWDAGRQLPPWAAELGVALLVGYMCADSFTSTWQGKLFKEYRECSELEMMLGMNSFSSLFTLASLVVYNQLTPSLLFTSAHPHFLVHLLLMSLSSAVGQLFIFHTIASHGAVAFASIMTARQLLSLVLSVLLFGHAIGWDGIAGLALVFVSLGLKIREDLHKKDRKGGKGDEKEKDAAAGHANGAVAGKEKQQAEKEENV